MDQVSAIFEGFSKVNVLVVGDIMIDRYLTGAVQRISPEAPVPIVDLGGVEDRLGGAANVALNIRALGATPYLLSVIGQDAEGHLLQQMLPDQGINAKHLIVSKGRPTTLKTRILANNQQLLRVDHEMTHDLEEREAEDFLEQLREVLEARDIQVILLQDYNKGVLSPRIISELILEGVRRDIPITVDPKFKNFWAYKHVTLFKPNLKEIRAQLTQAVDPNLESLQAAAQEIQSRLGNRYTLITLSEKGLFWGDHQGGQLTPTLPRAIADVCGAGDTVISIAALGLALGVPPAELAVLANLAGGQVCERVGVVPVDKAQLQREFRAWYRPTALS